MAKKTIRIPLHKDQPEKLMALLHKVLNKHQEMGADSPLQSHPVVNMAEYETLLHRAAELRAESIKHRAQAEACMNEANALLGRAAGQTINHRGTLLYMLNLIKQYLKVHYTGIEESLSGFGFDVVIDTAKGVGRKRKSA